MSPAPAAAPVDAAQVAIREALGEFLVVLDPATARKIAVACLRLAAAMVAVAAEVEATGPRGAATELLLMLAEGLPELPAAVAA